MRRESREIAFVDARTNPANRRAVAADLNRINARVDKQFANRQTFRLVKPAAREVVAVDFYRHVETWSRRLYAAQDVEQNFRASRRRAAEFVRAPIDTRADESAQEKEVRRVNLHAVEAASLRPTCRVDEHFHDGGKIYI